MNKEQGRKPEGTPERAHHAGAGAPSGANASTPQRFSAARKVAAVTRLLRGEPLEVVARELNVTVARLPEWRERALAAAAAAMKERERDERDAEIARLKAKVGEITMANELLEETIAALEGKRPLARRRSRR
ncbi:transposase [Azospirillum sp. YIM DDC1]|uniref:Transposase n=1 Tax=Azospirillum aestuarii TaxID=2802052 RepID=A0ABS1I8P1_9PROT|nr:transposase [Azospirillum aestuarii]MBK4723062.1 transposase [Azospirillum aestuarii]